MYVINFKYIQLPLSENVLSKRIVIHFITPLSDCVLLLRQLQFIA